MSMEGATRCGPRSKEQRKDARRARERTRRKLDVGRGGAGLASGAAGGGAAGAGGGAGGGSRGRRGRRGGHDGRLVAVDVDGQRAVADDDGVEALAEAGVDRGGCRLARHDGGLAWLRGDGCGLAGDHAERVGLRGVQRFQVRVRDCGLGAVGVLGADGGRGEKDERCDVLHGGICVVVENVG